MNKIKNFFRSEKGQVAIALIVALSILVLTYTSVFLFQNRNVVFAEELSNNAILNFNQLAFTSYNTSVTGVNMLSHDTMGVIHITGSPAYNTNFAGFGNDISTTAGHKYYLSMIKDDSETRFVYNLFGSNVNVYTNVSMVYTSTGVNARLGFFAYSNKVYNTYVKINLVDLTAMFGAGNEPSTVEEVKNYLPLDFYSYNPGTPVYFNNIEAFTNGYNTALSSFDVKYLSSDSYNNLYALTSLNSSSFVSKSSNIDEYNLVCVGYVGMTFNNVVPKGTTINVSFGSGSFIYDYTKTVSIGFLNSNNFISVLDYTVSSHDLSYFDFTLTVPFDTDTIVFYSSLEGSTNMYTLNNVEVSYKVYNLNNAIESAYQRGVDSVNTKIYYDNGYRAGLTADNPYTFRGLIGAVLDAPVQAVTGLLDFDILGVNMRGLYFSLFTLALIIAVVKLALGK